MSTLHLGTSDAVYIDITVEESDRYTETVRLKIDRECIPGRVQGCNEVFITPRHLDAIGRFMIRQAEEIRNIQKFRSADSTTN